MAVYTGSDAVYTGSDINRETLNNHFPMPQPSRKVSNIYQRADNYYNMYDIYALLDENDFIKLFSIETYHKDADLDILTNIFKNDNIKIELVTSSIPSNIIEESKELFNELMQFDDNIYESLTKYIELQTKMIDVNSQLKILQNNLFCNKIVQPPNKENSTSFFDETPPIGVYLSTQPSNNQQGTPYFNNILTGYEENNKYSSFNKAAEIDESSTIFYNSFSKTFYLFNNTSSEFETIKRIKNCGFEKLLDIDLNLVDKKIMDTLLFSRKYDKNEISKVIELFKSTIKNNSDIELEKQIQNYIEFNYVITGELNDKIPAKKIKDDLASTLKLPASQFVSFRNKLGPILINLGLQKKRYKEGIFYYGLKKKDLIDSKDKLTDEQMTSEFRKLLKERENLISTNFPRENSSKDQIVDDLMKYTPHVSGISEISRETFEKIIS
ncbi:hypothetical protein crov415 [Cafeteria roenbergensis virus]|uniref:Uncharacterized protein n=1 Tax=Cafeteria roenbergensis virus (strain BV-PW1) TaxID=693272 RepID=E3T5I6_CROVB|nr:hypothetical protein crov415 [Cafeteria roenbergensis virus BV-PW1]ADO67449.1 hypothetical protein crov415 [Cafeteria roenbergensis virus BV-PW1]